MAEHTFAWIPSGSSCSVWTLLGRHVQIALSRKVDRFDAQRKHFLFGLRSGEGMAFAGRNQCRDSAVVPSRFQRSEYQQYQDATAEVRETMPSHATFFVFGIVANISIATRT